MGNGLPPRYDFVPPLYRGPACASAGGKITCSRTYDLEVPVILQLRSATMRGGHCTPRAREEKLKSSEM